MWRSSTGQPGTGQHQIKCQRLNKSHPAEVGGTLQVSRSCSWHSGGRALQRLWKPLQRSGEPVTHPLYPSVGDAPILSDELMLLTRFPVPAWAGKDTAVSGILRGYCPQDLNGQHLPLWQTFFIPLGCRAKGVWRVGARWVSKSICPRLELHSCPNYYLSSFLISPPRPSAAAEESVPSVHWRDISTSIFFLSKKRVFQGQRILF